MALQRLLFGVSARRIRTFHCSLVYFGDDHSEQEKAQLTSAPQVQRIIVSGGYNELIESAKQRSGLEKREQFALVLNEFLTREKYRKGHVPFIRLAMQRMEEFGLEKDLLTYNRVLDVFPKGRFAPIKMIDAFWPRPTPQLELCLEVLTKMEENGIRPSTETYNIVKAVFGRSIALEKCIRIMYLFDKFRDIDPYEIRTPMLPTDPVALSRLALFRMAGNNARLMEVEESGVCIIAELLVNCKITILFLCRLTMVKSSSLVAILRSS